MIRISKASYTFRFWYYDLSITIVRVSHDNVEVEGDPIHGVSLKLIKKSTMRVCKPMSSVKQQQQKLSQMQSSLAKKSQRSGSRSRSRSRSRDRKEKMNSKQRRQKNRPLSQKRAPRISNSKIGSGSVYWDKLKTGDIDFAKARACLQQRVENDVKTHGCDHVTGVVTKPGFKCKDGTVIQDAVVKPLCIDNKCSLCKKKVRIIAYASDSKKPIYASLEVDEKTAVIMENPETLKQLYDFCVKEWDMARNAVRAGLGNHPIRIQLTDTFVITTIVTTGVTNIVTVSGSGSPYLLPGGATEFNTLASLFDEFKCSGGYVDFLYNNFNVGPGAAVTANSQPCIAYDPSDNATVASVEAACQQAQHKLLSPVIAPSTSVAAAVPSEGIKHHFPFHVPPGILTPNSLTTIGNQWQATNGTTNPIGALKFYHVGAVVTAINTGAGIVFYECEFRCRS